MAEHGIRGEVVISDNGSTDGSVAVADAAGARGQCRARRIRLRRARGKLPRAPAALLMADGDQSHVSRCCRASSRKPGVTRVSSSARV